jgi:DNA-damage-inducible protein D
MEIIIYEESRGTDPMEEFIEKIHDAQLRYLASELLSFGINDISEIEAAVNRALHVCRAAGLPAKHHFKPVYVYDRGGILADWRLSALGRKLVLLNANPENPYVARLQLELVGGS